MQQTLVINGSARPFGNTRQKLQEHLQLVPYDLINLCEHLIEPYNYDHGYSPEDAFEKITQQILQYNTIIFATPVYWYAMAGRMKNFLDRTTDWVTVSKHVGRKMKGKNISVLAVGTDANLPDGFTVPFFMTANYFEMNFKGCIYFCVADEA